MSKDQNTGIRVRRKKAPYTIVPNEMLESSGLSWKAKGILAYLLGRPDNWKGKTWHLAKIGKDGQKAVRSAFLELRCEGWAKLESETTGDFMDRFYLVADEPVFFNDPDNEALRARESGIRRRWQLKTSPRSVISLKREGGLDHNGQDPNGHDHNGHDQNGHISKKEPNNVPATRGRSPEEEKTTTITAHADAVGGNSSAFISPQKDSVPANGQETNPVIDPDTIEHADLFIEGWVGLIRKIMGHKIMINKETRDRVIDWFDRHPKWSGIDLVYVAFKALILVEANPRPKKGETDNLIYARFVTGPEWFVPTKKNGTCKVYETALAVKYNRGLTTEQINEQISAYFR